MSLFLRSLFKFLLNMPVIGNLLKMSDSILLGAVYGTYLIEQYEESLNYAFYGLSRKRKKHGDNPNWDIMDYAIKSATKLNRRSDYEKLYQLAIASPDSVEGREVGKIILRLAMWAHTFKDREGVVELVNLASHTDKTWGEPDFLMGWFNMPSDESINYFRQAIEKDESYKKRILNDTACNRHSNIIAEFQ